MAEHTPGPWCVEAIDSEHLHDICLAYTVPNAGNPVLVATVFGDDDDDPVNNRQAEANARLIAAAPDLLAALLPMLRGVEQWERGSRLSVYVAPGHLRCSLELELGELRAAAAAIAKATGRGA